MNSSFSSWASPTAADISSILKLNPSRWCTSQSPLSERPWLTMLRSSRSTSGSSVVIIPPSPVVICLFG